MTSRGTYFPTILRDRSNAFTMVMKTLQTSKNNVLLGAMLIRLQFVCWKGGQLVLTT